MEVYSEEEESDSEGWGTRTYCLLKWEEGLPVMRVGHQGPGPGPAMSTLVQVLLWMPDSEVWVTRVQDQDLHWVEEGDLGWSS